MFWDDIKEIRGQINNINNRLTFINESIERLLGQGQERSEIYLSAEGLKERFEEYFCSDDEYNSINRIHDKLNSLINDTTREEKVTLAIKTLDKFEDYMKNVEKVNVMINEFKGCVSMARGALGERKELNKEVEEMKKLTEIAQHIYKSMLDFIQAGKTIKKEAHYKIDAIYLAICEKNEEKPPKKRKTIKKSAVSEKV